MKGDIFYFQNQSSYFELETSEWLKEACQVVRDAQRYEKTGKRRSVFFTIRPLSIFTAMKG